MKSFRLACGLVLCGLPASSLAMAQTAAPAPTTAPPPAAAPPPASVTTTAAAPAGTTSVAPTDAPPPKAPAPVPEEEPFMLRHRPTHLSFEAGIAIGVAWFSGDTNLQDLGTVTTT